MFARTLLRSSLARSARAARSFSSASSSAAPSRSGAAFASAAAAAALGAWALSNSWNDVKLDGPMLTDPVSSPAPSAIEQKAQEAADESQPSASDSPYTSAANAPELADDEDAASQGAVNPITGEINWDCPCLGGMAHGPCGEEFKAAFSCFVYSEAEPKGIDCVDKFKAMQDCFRRHPEFYGEEIDDEDAPAEVPQGGKAEKKPREDDWTIATREREAARKADAARRA